MRALLSLLLAVLVGCAGEPAEVVTEPVLVRASVDSADVTPGRAFEVTVVVNKQADATFELPDLGTKIERLVIEDQTRREERAGDRLIQTDVYTLKAPISGTFLIPGVEAPWRSGDVVGTAGTGPILIEAGHSGGAEDEELRDLKGLAKADRDLEGLVVGGLLLALLASLLAAVASSLRRRRVEVVPPPPAHEVAAAALRALRASALDDEGAVAYELSAILRRYLEARFGFRAWRMTTGEVLRALPPELSSLRAVEQSVREVLEASDLVKFAGEPVGRDALLAWVDRALSVVEATQPRLEEAA